MQVEITSITKIDFSNTEVLAVGKGVRVKFNVAPSDEMEVGKEMQFFASDLTIVAVSKIDFADTQVDALADGVKAELHFSDADVLESFLNGDEQKPENDLTPPQTPESEVTPPVQPEGEVTPPVQPEGELTPPVENSVNTEEVHN